MSPLHFLKSRYTKSLQPREQTPRTRRRPMLEVLEDRTVPTAIAAPSGLISWWTADNMAIDLMGLNDATLADGASFAAGKVGQAFSFDGVDDRAAVADSDSLKLTGSMTIEAWVLADSLPAVGGGPIFFRGDDRGGLDPYQLSTRPGGLTFQIQSLTTTASVQAPLPLGVWTHVAGTLDDATGTMRLYVNGVLAAETITDVRPFRDLDPASNPGIGIGNHGGYPGSTHNQPFDGLIDELSIYNRALTSEEVLGIFNAGSDGKIKSPAPSGAVSWWTGDGTADDLIGPNHGALFNGAAFAPGQVGDGFIFDGINDNFQAPTTGLPTGSANRTLELWVRINQQTTNESFFATYGTPGLFGRVYTLGRFSDNRLFVSTWGPAIAGPIMQDDRWYHVAATNVGQTFRLYLDGVEVASGNMAVNTPAGSTFWLGRQTTGVIGDSRRLDGMVDEVTVYNRALSAAEIQAIHAAGSHGKIKPNEDPTVASPILDRTVLAGSPAVLDHADLNAVFDDLNHQDSALSYTITGNTAAAVVTATIEADDTLDLSFAPGETGVADITVRATDPAGDFVEETFQIRVLASGATTTVITVTGPSPSAFGQTVTFTATVTPQAAGGPLPTGTLLFKEGAVTLGTSTALSDVGGVATATFTTTATQLGVGAHTISALYFGDADSVGSASAELPHTVNQAATTTTITQATPSPSIVGQAVTFTVTVGPNQAGVLPTGTLTFKDGATTLGDSTPLVNVGGVARATFTATAGQLQGGDHTITAVYPGDANYAAGVSADFSHTVNRLATTVAFTAMTPSPSTFGQPVTFTVTVVPNQAGVLPTGTLIFKEGDTTLGVSTPLVDVAGIATATFTTSANQLSAGVHTITAVYLGDATYAAGASVNLIHTVNVGPVALPKSYKATNNRKLVVPVARGLLANDVGDVLTAHLVRGPKTGKLTLNADGSFTYRPKAGFVGKATFSYRVWNGSVFSDAAVVTIRVRQV